jgi:hypothetical protein
MAATVIFERSFRFACPFLVDKEFARRAGERVGRRQTHRTGRMPGSSRIRHAETRCEGLDNRQRGGNRNRGIVKALPPAIRLASTVASGCADAISHLRRCRTQYARATAQGQEEIEWKSESFLMPLYESPSRCLF